jgi:transcription initiation factor TFIIIB Brf1 subunit/transcription initiation factor TFIIB
MRFDAEGWYLEEPCPRCGSRQTVTYEYEEGFAELECEACGFISDAEELSDLNRYSGELREKSPKEIKVPLKKIQA